VCLSLSAPITKKGKREEEEKKQTNKFGLEEKRKHFLLV
jgi:hypothetical protein